MTWSESDIVHWGYYKKVRNNLVNPRVQFIQRVRFKVTGEMNSLQ